MNLAKAIEILTLDVKGDTSFSYQDWQDALKLGLECTKEVICLRSSDHTLVRPLLPGETP